MVKYFHLEAAKETLDTTSNAQETPQSSSESFTATLALQGSWKKLYQHV